MYYDIKEIYILVLLLASVVTYWNHSRCRNLWVKVTSYLYLVFVTFKLKWESLK